MSTPATANCYIVSGAGPYYFKPVKGNSSDDNTRWTGSDTDKSIYDPCPAGWRVPDGGSNGVWSKAKGSSSSFSNSYNSTNEGMNFSGKFGSASTIWYPVSGYRSHISGADLYRVGLCGYCYSVASSSSWDSIYCTLELGDDGDVYTWNYKSKASGCSVRCIKE